MARVTAGAFGFLIFIQTFEGPDKADSVSLRQFLQVRACNWHPATPSLLFDIPNPVHDHV
jgi:hypothetical protein